MKLWKLLLPVVLLFCASTTYGQTCSNTAIGTGIVCVSSKSAHGTTSAAVTYASGYASGTMIVVDAGGSYGTAYSLGNISNTAGYTWTFWGDVASGNGDSAIWYTKVPSLNSSSDTITVSRTGGAGYVAINTVIYTGLSAIHGAGASATGTGTALASGAYTVSVYDILVGGSAGETLSPGSGWNDRADDDVGGTSPYTMIEDLIATTTTGNATFTNGVFDPWQAIGIAFTPTSAGGPVITSISSPSALPGDSIVVTGIGFTGSPTATVNGVSATVTGNTSTTVTLTVPSTTSGNIVVTVSAVASNPWPLTIGPVITGVSPIWGTVGASFTVTGISFGSTQGSGTLQINGVNATSISWGPTSITANAPNTGPGNVVVTQDSLASNGVYFRIGTTTPVLPQATVDLTMPTQGVGACATLTTGTNCVRTPASGSATDFQNAINAAGCGDTIVLAAGSTYSGNFTIPSTVCTNNSGWMVIESSALASLPASGHRVSPSNVSNMPLISTATTGPSLNFAPSSNHWRMIGLDITTSYVSVAGGNADNFGLVFVGLTGGGNDITTVGQLPNQIIFDRDLFLGLNNSNIVRGLLLQTQATAVVDSYCDEIHANDRDAQCFNSYNGTGPFLFQNNFVQASGENIMFGGSDPAITNLVPSDITIIGNDIEKNVAWMNVAPWTIKNLIESKNFQRVLIDGNVIQNTWGNQQNEALLFRSVNQGGTCRWCASADITLTHNLVAHAGNALEIDPEDGTHPSLATQRVLAQNNVFTDIDGATWGNTFGGGGIYVWNAIGSFMPKMHDIFIDHNDSFMDSKFMYFGDNGTVSNARFTNNLSDYGSLGSQGTSVAMGDGLGNLNMYMSPYTWTDNVFDVASSGYWPTSTLWSGTLAGLGMTAATGTDPNIAGNLQLTSGSTYHNAGSDGKDIGVYDWTCYNAETAAALAGTFTQALQTANCSGVVAATPAAPSRFSITGIF